MAHVIEGLASVFYNANDPGTEYQLAQDVVERVMPTAFDRALQSSAEVLALWNHNADFLLGRRSAGTLRLTKTAKGLAYSVDYNHEDPQHQSVYAKLKRGDVNGSSFSFQVRDENVRRVNGGFVRELTDLKLIEVSPVWRPAYPSSTASARTLSTPGSVRWCAEDPGHAERWARYQRTKRIEKVEREMVLDRVRYLELTR
jgi:HK97 family phage prohead protease